MNLHLFGLILLAPCVFAQTPDSVEPNLNESIVEIPSDWGVKLKTTVFKPPGDGPFPLVVMNHGKSTGNPHFQSRARFLNLSAEMVRLGYVVILPNRKGVAGSGGVYMGGGCAVTGMARAQADDVLATLAFAAKLPYVDARRVLLMGQSHGGMTALAFAARPAYPGVLGVVNFAGGNKSDDCNGWENNMRDAFGEWGRSAAYPSLWFYGDNDSYFPPRVYRPAHAAYVAAGAKAELVEFGVFAPGDAHGMAGHIEGVPIWLPRVKDFLARLGLPSAITSMASHASVPAKTGFARVDDLDAVPSLSSQGRDNYRKYLAFPGSKAFVLVPDGRHWWVFGGADPVQRALDNCRKVAERCALYAVNDEVVWQQ